MNQLLWYPWIMWQKERDGSSFKATQRLPQYISSNWRWRLSYLSWTSWIPSNKRTFTDSFLRMQMLFLSAGGEHFIKSQIVPVKIVTHDTDAPATCRASDQLLNINSFSLDEPYNILCQRWDAKRKITMKRWLQIGPYFVSEQEKFHSASFLLWTYLDFYFKKTILERAENGDL